MTSSEPAVMHVIPAGNNVGGVTSLGNDVFVMRRNSQQIEVYDAVTFTLQRCLAVPQLGPRTDGRTANPRTLLSAPPRIARCRRLKSVRLQPGLAVTTYCCDFLPFYYRAA